MKAPVYDAAELARIQAWLTDQLQNNDVADDDEITDLIAGDTSALSREQIAHIVRCERPRFLVDQWHEIDWSRY